MSDLYKKFIEQLVIDTIPYTRRREDLTTEYIIPKTNNNLQEIAKYIGGLQSTQPEIFNSIFQPVIDEYDLKCVDIRLAQCLENLKRLKESHEIALKILSIADPKTRDKDMNKLQKNYKEQYKLCKQDIKSIRKKKQEIELKVHVNMKLK
jgi:hypothetical protein